MIDKNHLQQYPWTLIPSWLDQNQSDFWRYELFSKIRWERPILNVYGKQYPSPRLCAFIGDINIKYSYSGVTHIAYGWPNWFQPLLKDLIAATGSNFNGCLINLYRDGKDKMGWHADDESVINSSQPIASLSLGAQRDFVFKNRFNGIKQSLCLSDGDLLLMEPDCQLHWIHSLPARQRVKNVRINLTFRCYLNCSS